MGRVGGEFQPEVDRKFSSKLRNSLWRLIGCGLSLGLLWWMMLQGIKSDKWWIFRDNPDVKNDGLRFGDLALVAQWNDCVGQVGLEGSGAACGRTYPVGSVIITRMLGLSPDSVEIWGISLAVAMGIGLSFLIVISWIRQSAVIGFCLSIAVISPATSLLLERGNLDVIMWLLALVALALVFYGRVGWFSLLVCIGVAIKLYSVGILLALFAKTAPRAWRIGSTIFTLTFALLVIGQSLIDDSGDLPQPIGASFGALHLAYGLRLVFTGEIVPGSDLALVTVQFPIQIQDRLLSILLFGSMTAILWTVFRRIELRLPSSRVRSWFLGSAGLFLLMYVVTPSFDYRLTFLILVIFGLGYLAREQSKSVRSVIVTIAAGLSLSTWLSVPMPAPLIMIGDVLLSVTLSALAALVVLVLAPPLQKVIQFRRVSSSNLGYK